MFVLTNAVLIDVASCALDNASWDPPLNPSHPDRKISTPNVTNGTLDGGVALTVPSERNLPSRGPIISSPAKAAQPPVLWTTEELEKSPGSLAR